MTIIDKLIETAEEQEKRSCIGSSATKSVKTDYGIGFIEGGMWMLEQMLNEQIKEQKDAVNDLKEKHNQYKITNNLKDLL